MDSEQEFSEFSKNLIFDNNLETEDRKKFNFVSYEKYNTELPYNYIFYVYEDRWISKPEIIKSKIKSILQISNRIYARQCEVKKITKPEADIFLKGNHIYGTVNSKLKYGLFYQNELFAVAVFASQRKFRDGSRSGELLRFCTKNGYSVIGGLDKLLQAYIRAYKPDTLMTYIDLEWGRGDAFLKLGFEKTDFLAPKTFYVNKKNGERIPEKYFSDFENINNYVKFKNSGSLKMIKMIN
ncbi:MAG: hypothetical protein GXO80_08135 [Chlorobi bacterium]|nr:hypothetical protein [Chlorobiota bacterium]